MDTETTDINERRRSAGSDDDRTDAGPFGRAPRPRFAGFPKLDLLGFCLGVILLPLLLDQTIVSVLFSDAVVALRQVPRAASPRSRARPRWTPAERPASPSSSTSAPDARVVVVEAEEAERILMDDDEARETIGGESSHQAGIAVTFQSGPVTISPPSGPPEYCSCSLCLDHLKACPRWGSKHPDLDWGSTHAMVPAPCRCNAILARRALRPLEDWDCECKGCEDALKHDPQCFQHIRHWMQVDMARPCNCQEVRERREARRAAFSRAQAERSLDALALPARKLWSRPSADFQTPAGEAFLVPGEQAMIRVWREEEGATNAQDP